MCVCVHFVSEQALGLWMKSVEEDLAVSEKLIEDMQSNFA